MRKRNRLRTDAQFKRVRGEGRSWAHPLVVLYALPNQEGVSRVGFSVSKRVGKAVSRNRAKRLLREAIRPHLVGLKPGYDLVLIARAPIAAAGLRDVVAAVDYLLQRAKIRLPRETGRVEAETTKGQPDGERGLAQ